MSLSCVDGRAVDVVRRSRAARVPRRPRTRTAPRCDFRRGAELQGGLQYGRNTGPVVVDARALPARCRGARRPSRRRAVDPVFVCAITLRVVVVVSDASTSTTISPAAARRLTVGAAHQHRRHPARVLLAERGAAGGPVVDVGDDDGHRPALGREALFVGEAALAPRHDRHRTRGVESVVIACPDSPDRVVPAPARVPRPRGSRARTGRRRRARRCRRRSPVRRRTS